jgi:hypothetical protein
MSMSVVEWPMEADAPDGGYARPDGKPQTVSHSPHTTTLENPPRVLHSRLENRRRFPTATTGPTAAVLMRFRSGSPDKTPNQAATFWPIPPHRAVATVGQISPRRIGTYSCRRPAKVIDAGQKISGSTRSDEGRRCRDTFASLKKTCRKNGISFWEYLLDRLRGPARIAPLATWIFEPVSPTMQNPSGRQTAGP